MWLPDNPMGRPDLPSVIKYAKWAFFTIELLFIVERGLRSIRDLFIDSFPASITCKAYLLGALLVFVLLSCLPPPCIARLN